MPRLLSPLASSPPNPLPGVPPVSSASVAVPEPIRTAHATLVLRIAGRPGPTFTLDPTRDNTLGRSAEATIVVADRLASRGHAAVRYNETAGTWTLHDLGSRNGTFLSGDVVTTAEITDGAVIRIGTSELIFRQPPVATASAAADDRGHFVRCGPVAELEGSVLRRSSIGSTDDARRPLLLYQTSIRLLASRNVREVIEAALELAVQHCGATSVGWFRVVELERLEPVCVVPPASDLATLIGEPTARLVVKEGNAVWMSAPHTPGVAVDAEPEIACVPIMEGERVHAALVAAAASGSMRNTDFDFLVALASLASAAYAGHSGATSGCSGGLTDLSSLQTIDLESVLMMSDAEEGTAGATAAFSEVSLRQFTAPGGDASPATARIGSFVAETGTLKLDDWQRILVIEALRRTGGSVPSAAAELGISRATLYRKLELYGLTRS